MGDGPTRANGVYNISAIMVAIVNVEYKIVFLNGLMNNESTKEILSRHSVARCGLKTKLHENMIVLFYYSILVQYVSILLFAKRSVKRV